MEIDKRSRVKEREREPGGSVCLGNSDPPSPGRSAQPRSLLWALTAGDPMRRVWGQLRGLCAASSSDSEGPSPFLPGLLQSLSVTELLGLGKGERSLQQMVGTPSPPLEPPGLPVLLSWWQEGAAQVWDPWPVLWNLESRWSREFQPLLC